MHDIMGVFHFPAITLIGQRQRFADPDRSAEHGFPVNGGWRQHEFQFPFHTAELRKIMQSGLILQRLIKILTAVPAPHADRDPVRHSEHPQFRTVPIPRPFGRRPYERMIHHPALFSIEWKNTAAARMRIFRQPVRQHPLERVQFPLLCSGERQRKRAYPTAFRPNPDPGPFRLINQFPIRFPDAHRHSARMGNHLHRCFAIRRIPPDKKLALRTDTVLSAAKRTDQTGHPVNHQIIAARADSNLSVRFRNRGSARTPPVHRESRMHLFCPYRKLRQGGDYRIAERRQSQPELPRTVHHNLFPFIKFKKFRFPGKLLRQTQDGIDGARRKIDRSNNGFLRRRTQNREYRRIRRFHRKIIRGPPPERFQLSAQLQDPVQKNALAFGESLVDHRNTVNIRAHGADRLVALESEPLAVRPAFAHAGFHVTHPNGTGSVHILLFVQPERQPFDEIRRGKRTELEPARLNIAVVVHVAAGGERKLSAFQKHGALRIAASGSGPHGVRHVDPSAGTRQRSTVVFQRGERSPLQLHCLSPQGRKHLFIRSGLIVEIGDPRKFRGEPPFSPVAERLAAINGVDAETVCFQISGIKLAHIAHIFPPCGIVEIGRPPIQHVPLLRKRHHRGALPPQQKTDLTAAVRNQILQDPDPVPVQSFVCETVIVPTADLGFNDFIINRIVTAARSLGRTVPCCIEPQPLHPGKDAERNVRNTGEVERLVAQPVNRGIPHPLRPVRGRDISQVLQHLRAVLAQCPVRTLFRDLQISSGKLLDRSGLSPSLRTEPPVRLKIVPVPAVTYIRAVGKKDQGKFRARGKN